MEQVLRDLLYNCESHHWWWRSRWKILGRIIQRIEKESPPLKILDAGCSTGALWPYLSRRHLIFGCDTDAQALGRLEHPDRCLAAECDLEAVPVKAESMDVVLALDMLEHLREEGTVLDALRNVLKPGGCLIATAPAYQWLWSEWDEYNHHFRRYTLSRFRAVIQSRDFRVVYASYFNAFLFMPFALIHLRNKVAPVDPLKQAAIPKFNSILEFVFSFERYFLGGSFSFPVGSSVLVIARKI